MCYTHNTFRSFRRILIVNVVVVNENKFRRVFRWTPLKELDAVESFVAKFETFSCAKASVLIGPRKSSLTLEY